MEIYCRKNVGSGAVLEYKMTKKKESRSEFGEVTTYGIRAKFITSDDFRYANIDDIAPKPQLIMQIIKQLFENNVMPDNLYDEIEDFLRTSVKIS